MDWTIEQHQYLLIFLKYLNECLHWLLEWHSSTLRLSCPPKGKKIEKNMCFFTYRWDVIFFCKILYCTRFSYIYIYSRTHNSQKVNVMHNVAKSQRRLYVAGFIYEGYNLLPKWFECMSNWFVVVCRSCGASSLQSEKLKCVLLNSIRQNVKWNT